MTPTTTITPEATIAQELAPENINQNPNSMLPLAEQKKREIEDAVCQLYNQCREQNPGASWHKLTVMVAAQTGYSPEGIKGMLKRNGITNQQKRG